MRTIVLIPACTVFVLAACNRSGHSPSNASKRSFEEQASVPTTDAPTISRKKQEAVLNYLSSSAASNNPGDSLHRFVRTANLKFRVKNVIESTYAIEDYAARHGGYVEYTDLASRVNKTVSYAISADSSMEVTDFTVTNTMTLRVPQPQLDTLLKDISRTVEYLDYRIIKAKDVSLDLLANQLKQARAERMQQRLGTEFSGPKNNIADKAQAAELLEQQEEEADNARIEDKRLEDNIRFSTIKLQLYQDHQQQYRRFAATHITDAYQPGFGTRFTDALAVGWQIIVELVVLLTHLWVFIVLGIGVIWWYRGRRKSKRAAATKTGAPNH